MASNKNCREVKKLFLVLTILIPLLVFTDKAYAISDPDSLQIRFVNAYRSVIETNDILYVVSYDVEYTSTPVEPISDTYIARILTLGGSELQAAVPVPYFDNGYGRGVTSFYFTEDQVTDLGIVWGDAYTVRFQGNPSSFPSPPAISTGSINYRNQFATQFHLQNDIYAEATSLQLVWSALLSPDSISLVESQGNSVVFTTDGEDYFLQAIPNLNQMIPDMFTGSNDVPNFQDLNRPHDQSYRDQLKAFWDNTFIGERMDQFAAAWFVPVELVRFGIWMVVCGVISSIFLAATQRGDMSMIVYTLLIPVGAYIGLVDLVFAALFAFLMGMGTVYIFFYKGT